MARSFGITIVRWLNARGFQPGSGAVDYKNSPQAL
jgi:hypothetical protein